MRSVSMRITILKGACVLSLFLLATSISGQSATVRNAPPTDTALGARVEVSSDPSVVVLEYDQQIGMIAEHDPVPRLRIYADGRYVVHHPNYMKARGDWEGRLDAAQVRSLLLSIAGHGLLAFDRSAVESELRAVQVARRTAARAVGEPIELFAVSDRESIRLRVRLARYKPAGVLGAVGEPLEKEIVWWGLRHDARRFPTIRSLAGLAAIENELLNLTRVEGLRRIVGEVEDVAAN